MSALHEQACQHDVVRLDDAAVTEHMRELNDDWVLQSPDRIERTIDLGDYDETLTMVNAIAQVAIGQDHHPDICFGYRQIRVTYSTHSVQGLSLNDFICAARIDQIGTKEA